MKKNKHERREGALGRLEIQLESGSKNTKEGKANLTEKDIKRINKEISILENRSK
jgi:hypothetical protein